MAVLTLAKSTWKVILAAILFGALAAVLWGRHNTDHVSKTRLVDPVRHMRVQKGPNPLRDKYKSLRHDKWIVVTTIQGPTEQVRTLSTLPGWKLVVIGDRKTPEPWSLPGTIYISVDDQLALGYEITDFLPVNRYTRKSLGHLFAIEHGAELIYETDDDNVPTVDLVNFFLSETQMSGLVINVDQITYNPCRHFGQSTLWPRGFPLDRIGLSDPHDYRLCTVRTPPIQQGFVNGDPDLDALYRLTRKHNSQPLDLRFDGAAPPVLLPPGTFSPMNSQNTLYTRKALWALILPTTVTDRVTDIYRAYWSERLLWLIGEMVAFFPPNAYQKRSPHSYISDATMETEMYQRTPKLLEFLKSWTCSHNNLPDCAIEMSQEMGKKDFWRPADADLITAWFRDLERVGYQFPPLVAGSSFTSDCSDVIFYPDEKNTSWMYHPRHILPQGLTNAAIMETWLGGLCAFPKRVNYQTILTNTPPFQDVVVVVGVHDSQNIVLFHAMHKPHFPNLIYCASGLASPFFHQWNMTYIPVDGSPSGFKCLQAATKMRHLVSGYFYVRDNVLLNAKAFSEKDLKDVPWVSGEFKPAGKVGSKNVTADKMANCVKEQLQSKQELPDLPIYLPRKFHEVFSTVASAFGPDDGKLLDNVLPVLVSCAEEKTRVLSSTTLDKIQGNSNAQYVHPFNYQVPTGDSAEKAYACNYLQTL